MNARALYVGVLAAAMCAGVVRAEEQAERPMMRNFDRFELDTGTVRGFWLEVQTFYDTDSGMRALDTATYRTLFNSAPAGSRYGTPGRNV